jgi:SAM-dependent methyltransferase
MHALVKRSKWGLVGYAIAHSCRLRARYSLGHIDSASGSTHMTLPLERSVAYINRTYDDYLRYGALTTDLLPGMRILEGGPGDNLGVALRFVAAGAAQVVAMDRFYSRRDTAHQREIYAALRRQLPPDERRRYDRAVDLSSGVEFDPSIVTPVYGRGLEDFDDVVDGNSFDLIVSRAVLEEVSDTDRAFAGMNRALRPGGRMLHKIDLRDYGLFSRNGYHPLEFLTIPDVVYGWMSRNSDIPSRKRFDYYRRIMSAYGYDGDLFITMVARPGDESPAEVLPHKIALEYGVDYDDSTLTLVRSIRPRLARRFRDVPDEDLIVAGLFMSARKPA